MFDGTYTTKYTYDKANQLVREDNEKAGKSWYWTYNTAGNLWVTKEFEYTTGILGPATKTITNFYADYNSVWKDQLWTRDGVQFTYDGVGNTLYDGEWNYTWERGRQLKSMSNGSTTWNMTYDADGLRTKRTDGSNTYLYYYDGGLLRCMEYNGVKMFFTYDAQGMPVSMTYNGATYYYALNLQGDVMAILNASSAAVVNYNYNAWGELLSTTGSLANTIGLYNPLRYRGYIYDRETGLYYISSRYYNPEICRWINADSVLPSTGGSPIGYNMFAYCMNNPVNMSDPSGTWPKWATKLVAAVAVVAVVAVVATVCVATCGAGSVVAAAAAGAAKGAAIGLVSGAASGAAIGYATTGTLEGTLNGMADGALSGAISGVVSGGISGGAKAAAQSSSRVLWSGGNTAKNAAASYAKSIGGTTLEQTPKGKLLTGLTNTFGYNKTASLWQQASVEFAGSARGNVTAIVSQSGYRGAGSILSQFEYPMVASRIIDGLIDSFNVIVIG